MGLEKKNLFKIVKTKFTKKLILKIYLLILLIKIKINILYFALRVYLL